MDDEQKKAEQDWLQSQVDAGGREKKKRAKPDLTELTPDVEAPKTPDDESPDMEIEGPQDGEAELQALKKEVALGAMTDMEIEPMIHPLGSAEYPIDVETGEGYITCSDSGDSVPSLVASLD